jgi:hypothetical protein
MTSAYSTSPRVKRKDDSKKLTKVLSTKLSNEDYDRFEKYTNLAYEEGMISTRDIKILTIYCNLSI